MTLCEILTSIICWIEWLISQCKEFIWKQQNQSDARARRIQAAAEQDSRGLQQTQDLVSDSSSSPEFIKELLPSAERMALLYHLTYLYLRDFPELERLIRKRAVETQMLSGSSEALLEKCAGTSENFVTSLLPNLKVAAEKNKPQLALKHLEKAQGWISDIMTDVKDIVKRYNEHNTDVAATTSDIITETMDTEKQQQQQLTREMEELQKNIDGLEQKHLSISEEMKDYEEKIEEKNTEMHTFISSITGTDFKVYTEIVPFEESIINYVHKTMKSTSAKDQIRTLYADLYETTEAQKRLKEEEWDIEVKLTDHQLKLAKLKNGQLSSVIHLDDVQKSFCRIQQNLVQLQKFWEKVGSKLDTLKEKTFTGEILIDDLTDMKKAFLKSIDAAEEGWTKFGISCMKANNLFSIQMNEAYRFLEITPSSLSEEERQKECESVKEKLQNRRQNAVCSSPK